MGKTNSLVRNLASMWQVWMQKAQPRLFVVWGKHDLSFDLDEPERYRKDVPNADVHVLDAAHFALDTKADEIAALVLPVPIPPTITIP